MKIKLYTKRRLLFSLLFFIGFQLISTAQQVAKTIPSANALNGIIGFLEFHPSDYNVGKHPLIIFLHGVGERGNGTTDINLVTANAIPRFCANGATMRFTVGGQTSSFVVLSPQLYTAYGSWPDFYFQEMLKYAKANLNIDTNRIYVTGLSLGGGGTWRAITTAVSDDNQLAAAAPVCGTQDEIDANFCSTIGGTHLPVWAFHCYDDGTVPVNATIHAQILSTQCVPAMAPAPKFTFYQSGGHSGAWIYAYDTGHITTTLYGGTSFTANPNLYEWFLSNSRTASSQPVVFAGANQTITLPASTVNLSGTGTGQNGATIASYAWTKTSGPAAGAITSAGNASTTVTGLVQGVYVFTLTATDNNGLTGSSSVTITVNAAQPPLSNAGSNQTITLPSSTINLTGTGTGQNGATIASYAWTKTSGPAAGTITAAGNANTSVTGLVQGVYVFTLTVTDNNGLTGSSNVTITVNAAQPPLSNAGTNQTITLPTSTVSLTGTGTGQNGATITSYAWSLTSGPAGSTIASPATASTSVTGLVQGVYVFTLTVTDNNGLSASSAVTITVNAAGSQPPISNAGSNQTITLPTSTVNLTGTGVGQNGATIATYNWVKTSGPASGTITAAASAATTVTGLVQGIYVFTLTVTDNNGLNGSSSVTITVNAASNQPPVANAGINQSKTLPYNTATLNGSGTALNGATIVSYAWTQTSGPSQASIGTPAQASTGVTNLIQGVYVFMLTVTDNNGLTGTASVTITVNPAVPLPPLANAGSNQSITLPTSSVTLTGSGTGQNGASITNYSWVKSSGPAAGTIAAATNASTSVTGLVQGVYVFTLTITDNNGLTNNASVTITVNAAAAQPPVVSAGNNQSITLPTSSITLNGVGTGQNGATIVSYSWVKSSGPAGGTIGNASSASTTVTSLVQGVYVFALTVTDNNGLSSTASVTVTVNAAAIQPPVANAGNSQVISLPLNSITLSGTGTGSNGATIVSYSWSQSSGPSTATIVNATNATTVVNNLLQGVYVFTLTVTDNNGLTSSSSVTITVNPMANVPPVANAGNSQVINLPLNTISLSGSGAGSNGASIVSYSWSQSSGPASATIVSPGSAATTVNNLVKGIYVFTLKVTDNNGLSNSASVTVTVNAVQNLPPVASAGNSQVINLPTSSVTLTGTGTGSNGATIVSYAWSQSSGPSTATIVSAGTASTVVNNLVKGIYVFTLTVTDNNGLSSGSSVTITVNAAPNQAPVANAGADITITLPTNTANFNGTASSDPDGTIVSYSWNKLSGPGATTIVNSNTATASAIGLVAGVYVFELTVTDNSGATSTDQVMVTVIDNNSSNQLPIANAGKDTSINIPANTAILSGIGSKDPDGSLVHYSWIQVSGPVASLIADSNAVATTASGLVEGSYVFALTVTDNAGGKSTATITVTVVNTLRTSSIFRLFPNPVSGTNLHMEYVDDKNGTINVAAYDVNGRQVISEVMTKQQTMLSKDINVSVLKPGMYYLEVLQADGRKMVRPFVKQ